MDLRKFRENEFKKKLFLMNKKKINVFYVKVDNYSSLNNDFFFFFD